MHNEKFCRNDFVAKARGHMYVSGSQHTKAGQNYRPRETTHATEEERIVKERLYRVPHGTHVYVMQNDKGHEKWGCPEDRVKVLWDIMEREVEEDRAGGRGRDNRGRGGYRGGYRGGERGRGRGGQGNRNSYGGERRRRGDSPSDRDRADKRRRTYSRERAPNSERERDYDDRHSQRSQRGHDDKRRSPRYRRHSDSIGADVDEFGRHVDRDSRRGGEREGGKRVRDSEPVNDDDERKRKRQNRFGGAGPETEKKTEEQTEKKKE